MSQNATAGRGGTFCRFTIGSGERGASAQYLRYIANLQSVRDGREGVWIKALPKVLTEAAYPVMVSRLCQYAHVLERENIIGHKAKGQVRNYYAALVSFETPVSNPQAKQMLSDWMQEAFPRARAAAFIHRNTRHLHIHVWIAARQTDGKKINLSARAFRQLDEQWNRIYSVAMNRDEREHLLKKGQTERFKQLRREGKEQGIGKPERVGDRWSAAFFNDRERERLGAKWTYDRDEKGVGSHQPALTGNAFAGRDKEHTLAAGERSFEASTESLAQTLKAARQTVSDALRLYQDAQRVAYSEPGRQRELEPERER